MTKIEIDVDTIKRGTDLINDTFIAQALLVRDGFPLHIDGAFGAGTEMMVKRFQAEYKLLPDGIIGPQTWAMLANPREPEIAPSPHKLAEADFVEAAALLALDIATIKAVCEVESNGSGFLDDGRPKILFEGHVFYRELLEAGFSTISVTKMMENGNDDIIYPKWTSRYYMGGDGEWDRLTRALKIDAESALKSASWGLLQIMGNNHKACGFSNVYDFVKAMMVDERQHLISFGNFITSTSSRGKALVERLRMHDWAGFALGYNGSGYQKNKYDTKLEAAYRKYGGK